MTNNSGNALSSSLSSSSSSSTPNWKVMAHNIRENRWIVYAYCFSVVSLTAGVVYGWPALRQALRREDQQQGDGNDGDGNNENNWTSSETALGAAFTAGAWSTQGLRFFTGMARDRFGTSRVTAASLLAVAAGAVGIAYTRSPTTLGMALFCQGIGAGAQLCVQPVVAQLFPQHAGAALASLSGAFQISGLVYLAVTKIFEPPYQHGNTSTTTIRRGRRLGFWVYAALVIVLVVMALWLLPQGLPQQQQQQQATKQGESDNHDNDGFDDDDDDDEEHDDDHHHDDDTEQRQPSLEKKLKSSLDHPSASAHSTTVQTESSADLENSNDNIENTNIDKERSCKAPTITSTQSAQERKDLEDGCGNKNTDINNIHSNPTVEENSETQPPPSPKTAWHYVKTWKFILLVQWFSFTITPLQYYVGSIGFQLEDKGDDTGKYSDLFSILYGCAAALSPAGGYLADRYTLGVAQGLATTLSALSFFCLAVDAIPLSWQTVGLACNATGRMWVFGTYFAHVGRVFGYQNFGTLAGLGLLLSALVSLLQYPLLAAAAHGQATAMNVMCGGILTAELTYCYWLHRNSI